MGGLPRSDDLLVVIRSQPLCSLLVSNIVETSDELLTSLARCGRCASVHMRISLAGYCATGKWVEMCDRSQLSMGAACGGDAVQRVEAPLFDMEIRGVPALRFFGDMVWK